MKIHGINNAIRYKGAENKFIHTLGKCRARQFATIEDLLVKDKPAEFLSEEKELEIIEYMQKLEEQRAVEAVKAIETAKRIVLNV